MWCFLTAQNDGPRDQLVAGGVVTLETGRIFGGDSIMAYKGTYEVGNGRIEGIVDTWQFNQMVSPADDVFGQRGGKRKFEGQLLFEDREIVGHIWPEDAPNGALPIRLVKITDLD